MKPSLLLFLFLICSKFSTGQIFDDYGIYNMDNVYSISIPLKKDWTISTDHCDTANNIYQYFQLRKNVDVWRNKFSDIVIKYEINEKDILLERDTEGCLWGMYTKIDTMYISGFTAKRWFGTNCYGLIENFNNIEIASYTVYVIICLEPRKYVRIFGTYYSLDNDQLNSMESDLLSTLNNIKIYSNKIEKE